jgi:hypothetical protein
MGKEEEEGEDEIYHQPNKFDNKVVLPFFFSSLRDGCTCPQYNGLWQFRCRKVASF